MWAAGYIHAYGDGPFKNISEQQRNAAVSQQFESVLVKQFLKKHKPMFKGYSMKMRVLTECIVISLLMPFLKVLHRVGDLGCQTFCNNS